MSSAIVTSILALNADRVLPMRISNSQHRVPLRAPAWQIWPAVNADCRPWLHLQNIAYLLDQATANTESTSVSGKGKKRALSPQPSSSRLKRARTTNGSGSGIAGDSIVERNWPLSDYPPLHPPNCIAIEPHGEPEAVPVWKHTLEIQLYKDRGNLANMALEAHHRREEELFDEVLKASLGHIEEPVTVDLGAVDIFEFDGRLVASTPNGRLASTWLCLLPTLSKPRDDDSLPEGVEDLLMACHVMRLLRCSTIRGHMRLIVLPFDWTRTTMPEDVPLQLLLEFEASVILPFIFEPCPRGISKKMVAKFEQCKTQLLRHLYTPSIGHRSDAVVNIPFFYSNLRPAPVLRSGRADNAMQPKELIPQLLPFQRRSVAWLLHREGKSVTAEGKIIPSTNFKEHSFWEKIQEGNHTWYYNRLSESVSMEVMEGLPPALGGILAEEPGLGKTLETIALMLLNPAPLERNPSVKRWDPEARLEVKAIKVNVFVKSGDRR